jgi:hypothetical protein
MKNSQGCLHSEGMEILTNPALELKGDRSNNFKLTSLLASMHQVWQHWIHALTRANDVQVWQRTDTLGNPYWQAYNPATGQSISSASEKDILVWIEQGYYKSAGNGSNCVCL